MSGLTLSIDANGLLRALKTAPDTLTRNMNRAIRQSVGKMARSAKHNAPKAFSQLTHSISFGLDGPLSGFVLAGMDYSGYVETGTGPGGFPNPADIAEWMRIKQIKPRDPEMSQEDAAFLIARAIARHGTPEQPYMAPAFETHKAAAQAAIDRAIDKTLEDLD